MLWFHKPASELQILFQSGSGHLHLSVHVPRVAQIYVGVLCVPFICWQFFSIDLHICCLIPTDFQDFKGFLGECLVSFVPKYLVFFSFTTEMRFTLFFLENSLWNKEEWWTSG